MTDALHDAGNGVTWADSTQRVREFRKRKQLAGASDSLLN